MSIADSIRSRRRSTTALTGAALWLSVVAAASAPAAIAGACHQPRLVGRAVLPVETYAPGPPSGTLLPAGVVNGKNAGGRH